MVSGSAKPHSSRTLAEILNEYLEVRKLRASTEACYQRVIKDYLSDWLHKPLSLIDAKFGANTPHCAGGEDC